MMDAKQLQQLKQIAALKYARLRSDMAQLAAAENSLEENLRTLAATRTKRQDALLQESDAAQLAGADPRWHRWAESRRAAINTELAQIKAQRTQMISNLQKAFAQDQAIDALLTRAKGEESRARQRRATYES